MAGIKVLKHAGIMFAMALLPGLASAVEVVQLADNNTPPQRFMSLASERDGTAQAKRNAGATATAAAPRSDRTALTSGFMRIDRPHSVVIAPQHTLLSSASAPAPTANSIKITRGAVAPVEPDSEEISSDDGSNPVLSLFNDTGKGPLASFHDALRGGRTVSAAAAGASVAIPSGGKQAWPIPLTAAQKISSGYGERANPFGGAPEFHGGIDIAAAEGTPVLATADATVLKVGQDMHYGKFVVLQHADGIQTQYGHMSAQTVHEGDHVAQGQTIGAVGMTGRATGAHLDYRVSLNGERFDPLSILDKSMIAMAEPSKATKPVRPPVHDMMVKVVSVQ